MNHKEKYNSLRGYYLPSTITGDLYFLLANRIIEQFETKEIRYFKRQPQEINIV
jgi:hypothetical protein